MESDLNLVFASVFTAFFSTLASFITWRSSRDTLSGPGFWFGSFCCFSLSILIAVFAWPYMPLALNQALANTLEAAGTYLQFLGVLRFMNLELRRTRLATGIGLVVLVSVSIAFQTFVPGSHIPPIIETLINFLISMLVSFILAAHSPRIFISHRRFALGVFMFITSILGGQFLSNLFPVLLPSLYIPLALIRFVPDPSWSFFGPLYWILFMSILAFAENQLVNGRMLKKLKHTVERLARSEKDLLASNAEMHLSQKEFLTTLAEVMENRSQETAWHVVRVAEYSRLLVENLRLGGEEGRLIVEAAPLHDIGKTAIPDYILHKTGILDDEERALMHTHTAIGRSILMNSRRPLFRMAAVIAYEHHEHWDGSGYPEGKRGTGISVAGRIVGLADAFDALTTRRIYKPAWTLSSTLDFIGEKSGVIFEPALVDILFARIDQFREVMEKYSAE